MHSLILSLATIICVARGFTIPSQSSPLRLRQEKNPRKQGALHDASIDIQEMESARFAFWLCFYGAGGAASVGREIIPIRFRRLMDRKSLKGKGPSLGGEEKLELLPYVSGYPEDIMMRDVEKVVNNRLSTFQMIKKFPIEKETYTYTHMENPPQFLYYEAFALANKGANPLAVRAVFDGITDGGDTISAGLAQEVLESYKGDPNRLAKKLNRSKLLSLFAFVTVIGLVGLADYFAAYHLYKGWFPTWPGASNFPLSILDKDAGPLTIPQYWMFDIPKITSF